MSADVGDFYGSYRSQTIDPLFLSFTTNEICSFYPGPYLPGASPFLVFDSFPIVSETIASNLPFGFAAIRGDEFMEKTSTKLQALIAIAQNPGRVNR
ncbi:hypothetical protein BS47DRAFT_1400303 [Hydnum rufescens UP504]|uniref:Uncharacterized protein n=1 Tax=Hydnum rufescens UP504 TaxID=1448309 RepID=A0A9P6AGL5_9AGAM|nr:hypothetical protein BS47DRAFT_1400303 [Hydnum rufescens UP504]